MKTLDIFKDKKKLEFKEKSRKQTKIKMGEIIGNVNIVDCKRLEGLEEDLDLIISNISIKSYRGKERYIIKSENI